MELEVTGYTIDDAFVVRFPVDCDFSCVDLAETFITTTSKDKRLLIIDFKGTDYFDNAVVAMLVRLQREWTTRFRLVVPEAGNVNRILRAGGLLQAFHISGSVDLALYSPDLPRASGE